MKIRCLACRASFELEADRLNKYGSMVRCLKCSYIFMVYPPDYCGSPVTQDTNIDQSILNDLLKMQHVPGARISLNEFSVEGRNAMVETRCSMEDFEDEEDSASDADDTEYADLPDLSELEKMIDWEDLNDQPAKSDHHSNDTRGLDLT